MNPMFEGKKENNYFVKNIHNYVLAIELLKSTFSKTSNTFNRARFNTSHWKIIGKIL